MTGPLASLSENKSFSSSDRRKNTAAGTKNTGVHSSRPRETCTLTRTSRAIPFPALSERNVLIMSCLASSAWLGSLERRPSAAESPPAPTLERTVQVPGGRGSSTPSCLPSGTWALGDIQFADPAGATMGALCPQQPIASGSLLLIRSDAGLSRAGSAALAWETSRT